MSELQELYFSFKYRIRIINSIKYQEKAKTINDKKEKKDLLIIEKKKNLLQYKVNKNYIKNRLLEESKINENLKSLINEDNIDSEFIKLEKYFYEYNFYYKKYYNEERNHLFLEHDKILNWFKSQNNECAYCGIKSHELDSIAKYRGKQLLENGRIKILTKNLTLNGKKKRSKGTLEIERKNSETNLYTFDNIILVCPLCNNAKSNLINEYDWKKYFVPAMRSFYNAQLEEVKNGKIN